MKRLNQCQKFKWSKWVIYKEPCHFFPILLGTNKYLPVPLQQRIRTFSSSDNLRSSSSLDKYSFSSSNSPFFLDTLNNWKRSLDTISTNAVKGTKFRSSLHYSVKSLIELFTPNIKISSNKVLTQNLPALFYVSFSKL